MTLKELQLLKKDLTRHDYRYYMLNQPTISDQDYNMLYKMYEKALIEIIGVDTCSQEMKSGYPKWVKDEFSDYKPLT